MNASLIRVRCWPRYARPVLRFAVEAKYDGQRGLAVVDRSAVKILSRRTSLPLPWDHFALQSAICDRQVVLDGEIVALDKAGVPSSADYRGAGRRTGAPATTCCARVPSASTPSSLESRWP
jgi:hypothetical protein